MASSRGRWVPLSVFMGDTRRLGFSPTRVESVERGKGLSTRVNIGKDFVEEGLRSTRIVLGNLMFKMWGLTEKFKEKDTRYTGSATFTYDSFMTTVIPFLVP
ncbi:hypothetical protein GIB67_012815 [Kingdonia uniflora]|uniref:Uncharacterized protein n=1 Tax=Kingdonia uniflora TaxID=39325 RepID=A0A7J7NGB7_9MAGN|nr:hypothetical protein GIB67_012815 [Kingdonia uniflora]